MRGRPADSMAGMGDDDTKHRKRESKAIGDRSERSQQPCFCESQGDVWRAPLTL